MRCYASVTRSPRNLAALKAAGWRMLLSPFEPHPPDGFGFAIDNGAWSCFTRNLPFETEKFLTLVERHGAAARNFVVLPDIVAGGKKSFELSEYWYGHLYTFRRLLLPVQDGMHSDDVGAFLRHHPNCGLFLGGSVEWKLKTMYGWGMVAHAIGCYYHIARVNTVRRMRLAAEAGADSVDGTSVSRYAVNLPKLERARKQPSMLTPKNLEVHP